MPLEYNEQGELIKTTLQNTEQGDTSKSLSEQIVDNPFKYIDKGSSSIDQTQGFSEAERLGVSETGKQGYSNTDLSKGQGMGEIIANTMLQTGTNIVAGFVDGVASNDYNAIKDMVTGKERAYGNWLNDIAKDIKGFNQDIPIYQDGDSLDSVGYWANQVANLGYSGGLILETFAEQALLSAASSATFGATSGVQGASLLKKVNLLSKSASGKLLTNTAFGAFQGIKEGYTNALETYNGTLKGVLGQVNPKTGVKFTDEEAIKIASEAASNNYIREVAPLMILNGLQYMTLGKYKPTTAKKGVEASTGYSDAFGGVITKGVEKIAGKPLGRRSSIAVDYLSNGISEAIEEVIQTGIGEYAKHEALEKAGIKQKDFELLSTELRDSAIGGLLGGFLFKGLGDAFTKNDKTSDREVEERYQAFSEKNLEDLYKASLMVEAAHNSGIKEDISASRRMMQQGFVKRALELDVMRGSTSAFVQYTENLREISQAVEDGNLEKFKTFGINTEQDVTYIKEEFEVFLKDAVDMRDLYLKESQKNVTASFDSIIDIVTTQQAANNLDENVSNRESDLESLKLNDPRYVKLSENAKKVFDNSTELTALKSLGDNTLDIQKARIAELQESLKEDRKELNEVDRSRILNMDTNLYTDQQVSIASSEIKALELTKKAQELRDPNTQKKRSDAKYAALVAKSNKANEIKQAVEANKSNLTEEQIQAANVTQKNLETKEAVSDGRKVNNAPQRKAKIESVIAGLGNVNPEDLDLKPKAFNPDEATRQAMKNSMDGYAEDLKESLGREPSFEDFIKDAIELYDKKTIEETFYAHKLGWELTGRSIKDADKVYNKHLTSKGDKLKLFLKASEPGFTPDMTVEPVEDIKESNDEVIEEVQKTEAQVADVVPEETEVIYDSTEDTEFKTASGENKAATVGIERDLDDNGNLLDRAELNQNESISNKYWLDPNYILPETVLEVRVLEDTPGAEVSNWYEFQGELIKESLPFDQWMERNNVVKGSDEYWDKVPMVASYNGDDIFHIHDTGWFNTDNIASFKGDIVKQAEVIREGKTNTRKLRQGIRDGNTNIKVEERRFGQLDIREDLMPISKGSGDSQMFVAEEGGILRNFKGNADLPLVNKSKLKAGRTYDVRKVTDNSYIALEVMYNNPAKGERLDRKIFNNAKSGYAAYLMLNTEEGISRDTLGESIGMTYQQAVDLNREIDHVSNGHLSVTNAEGVSKFLRSHVKMGGSKTASNSFTQEIKDSKNIREGITYLSMDDKGILRFIQKGTNKEGFINTSNGITDKTYQQAISQFDILFNDDNGIMNFSTPNLGLQLRPDTTFPIININNTDTGLGYSVTPYTSENTEGNTYGDFVKDNFKTNIQSHQIDTKSGDRIWITDVQPKITFESTNEEVRKADIIKPTPAKIPDETISNYPTANKKEVIENLFEDNQITLLKHILKQEGNLDFKPKPLTEDQKSYLKNLRNIVSSIDAFQQNELVDHMFHSALSSIEVKGKVSNVDIANNIRNSVEEALNPLLGEYRNMKAKLTVYDVDLFSKELNVIDGKILQLESILNEQDKIISEVRTRVESFLGESIDLNEEQEDAKDFGKNALEKDIKLSFSNKLKLFFTGVKKITAKDSNSVLGYIPIEKYESIDEVVNTFVTNTVNIPSDKKVLIASLENVKNKPYTKELISKFKESPVELQNEILYKVIQAKLEMNFVQYSKDKKGRSFLKVLNSNSNSLKVKIRTDWIQDLINSPLTRVGEDGKFYMDKVEANNMLQEYESWNLDTLTNKQVIDWVSGLGITLSDNTIDSFRKGHRVGGNTINFDKFIKSDVLGYFVKNLKTINGAESYEVEGNSPLISDTGSALKTLIGAEARYTKDVVAGTIRIGEKNVQGLTQKTYSSDMKDELKREKSQLRRDLSKIPYSQSNTVLKMLENKDMRDKFEFIDISLQSIKEDKKESTQDAGITDLSSSDNYIARMGYFGHFSGDIHTEALELDLHGSLQFRWALLPPGALSDKSRQFNVLTPVLNLKENNFNGVNTLSHMTIKDPVLDYIIDQMFTPELMRIRSVITKPTDLAHYNQTGQIFYGMSGFNEVMYEGQPLLAFLRQPNLTEGQIEDIIKKSRPQLKDIIEETIKADVNKKIQFNNDGSVEGAWVESGFVDVEKSKAKILDTGYLKSKGSKSDYTNLNIAAHDYVINNLLNQSNLHQLFLGDLALYGKDRLVFNDKLFQKDVHGNPDPAFPLEGVKDPYTTIIAKTQENVTKRLAGPIAPGNKLANSAGEFYRQILLEDSKYISSTAELIVKQFYPDKLSEVQELLNSFEGNRLIRSKSDKNLVKRLQNIVPDIGDYFDIEATDAQEYTTWKEHMRVLLGQGRLDEETRTKYEDIYTKLSKGQIIEDSEVTLIMQPLKPVYFGNIADVEKGVNQIVYIKSSSIPLLPQTTNGLEIDGIRVNMEKLEASNPNETVRASYGTANKVGALLNPITTEDLMTKDFKDIQNDMLRSSLKLPRSNFKIQQDKPHKTSKNLELNKPDKITMGSQFWKGLLADGVSKIEDRIFPNTYDASILANLDIEHNDMLTGVELNIIKNSVESEYISELREGLLKELGIEDKFVNNLYDNNDFLQKVQKLLNDEATLRGYPKSDLNALNLVEDIHGNLVFNIPLFLSTSANKFESLLNAIVTNRLIKLKLPGNSYVATSEEGFAIKEEKDLDKSTIVFIESDRPIGQPLKATHTEDGKLIEAEVFLPYKFRTVVDGKATMVDLTKAPYSTRVNGKLVLNKEMVDKELLQMFSFRIPTSSHQSGAILKPVGFVTKAQGDMLVVPKDHTIQIGEDYDIDTRNVYHSNYVVDESTGRIEKLTLSNAEKNKEYEIDGFLKDVPGRLFGGYQEILDEELLKDKSRLKLLENAIIDTYKSVFTSPSNDIQNRINKVLSFKRAEDSVEIIDEALKSGEDNSRFSPFSDEYQRKQMELGASGKLGIGVHSNWVVLNGLFEQSKEKINILDIDGSKRVFNIGEFTSTGLLGGSKTLRANKDYDNLYKEYEYRTISDVNGENQNSATDNVKAQVMGRRNENKYTINVLALMNNLGFDAGRIMLEGEVTDISMPSLFISQPIIRDYVELLKKSDSIVSEFQEDKEYNIMTDLLKKYGVESVEYNKRTDGTISTSFLPEDIYETSSSLMSTQKLYDDLIDGGDKVNQLAVFQKFLELQDVATEVANVQSLINLNTSGLGISYFNVVDRVADINSFGAKYSDTSTENTISGVQSLVGEFKNILKEEVSSEDYETHTLVGNYLVKPTTAVGSMLVNSVSTAEKLWGGMFPYQTSLSNTLNSAIEASGKEFSKNQLLKFRYAVIDSTREYIYSDNQLGLYEGNVEDERFRLLFDKDGNTSLAKYLHTLKKEGYHLMEDNSLLKSFEFKNGKGVKPSKIIHETDNNTNFDRDNKYQSFEDMLYSDEVLPIEYNGDTITVSQLAQNLASYAFLTNNEKGAIGFRSFISNEYLNVIGYSDVLRTDFENGMFGLLDSETSYDKYYVPKPVKQFFQHNPQQAKKLNIRGDKGALDTSVFSTTNSTFGKSIATLKNFTLKGPQPTTPKFLSIRNTVDNEHLPYKKQFSLFQYDGSQYVRIPVLGDFGINYYSTDSTNVKNPSKPSIGQDVHSNINRPRTITTHAIKGKTVEEVLEGIVYDDTYGQLASYLMNYIDPETKFTIGNLDRAEGMYSSKTNTITLDENTLNYTPRKHNYELALEEIIHSITSRELDQYIDYVGVNEEGVTEVKYKQLDIPDHIVKLVRLFRQATKELGEQEVIDYRRNWVAIEASADRSPEAKASDDLKYRTLNLKEFVAGVFIDPAFRKRMDEISAGKESLLDKFKSFLQSLLNTLGLRVKGDSITAKAQEATLELLDYHRPILEENKVKVENTIEAEQLLEKLEEKPSKEPFSLGGLNLSQINPEDLRPKSKLDNYNPFDC